MDKIVWCIDTKNGIELTDPNDNLADGYIRKAEDSLETSTLAKSRDWKISAAYYAIYFSIYSLMMQLGIRCEIHSCTIEFTKCYLKGHLSNDDIRLIEKSFRARNDAQYYVNREIIDADYELILSGAPRFLAKCKNLILTEKEINETRAKIKALRNHSDI